MFLKPDYNLNNVYEINFEELKQQGVKCIMFDLDSTVMVSKAANFLPETVEWFNTFIKDFEVAIISNNNSETYIENASKLAPRSEEHTSELSAQLTMPGAYSG